MDSVQQLHNLSIYLARIHATTRKSTLALRQRKRFLVSQLTIFPDSTAPDIGRMIS